MPENAVRNMDATGYVSVVATEEVLRAMDPLLCAMDETEDEAEILALQAERDALLESDGVDLSYFFKDAEGNPLTFDMGNGYMVHADCVYVDPILYPDLSVIDRCAMMHDSGEQTEKMLEMWSRVKGDNLSPWMLGFIILSFVVIVVWVVWRKVDAYRKQQKMLKRHHHARKQQK
jgi:spermidine/putrescine transport system substrate-binding protein